MVTYIMPCPVISLSIAVYMGYTRKNRVLLALLTIWGLTGIKSIIFNAYEDTILLIGGLYDTAKTPAFSHPVRAPLPAHRHDAAAGPLPCPRGPELLIVQAVKSRIYRIFPLQFCPEGDIL